MRAERAPQLHLVTLEFVVEVLEQLTHLSSSPPPPEGCGAAKTAQAGGEEVAYSHPPYSSPSLLSDDETLGSGTFSDISDVLCDRQIRDVYISGVCLNISKYMTESTYYRCQIRNP